MATPPSVGTPEEKTPEEEQHDISSAAPHDAQQQQEPPSDAASSPAAAAAGNEVKFKSPLLQQMLGAKTGRLKVSSDKLSSLASEEETEQKEAAMPAQSSAEDSSLNGAKDTTETDHTVGASNTLISDKCDEDKDVDTLENKDSKQVAPPSEATGDLLGLEERTGAAAEQALPLNGFSQDMDTTESPTVGDTR